MSASEGEHIPRAEWFARWLRGVSWPRLLVGAVLVAFGLSWGVDVLLGFSDHRVGEALSLVGVLFLALPAMRLNAVARQRENLDDLIRAAIARSTEGITDEEKADRDIDIDRLSRKISVSRDTAHDWTPGAEICLVLGYLAIVAGSVGKLIYQ